MIARVGGRLFGRSGGFPAFDEESRIRYNARGLLGVDDARVADAARAGLFERQTRSVALLRRRIYLRSAGGAASDHVVCQECGECFRRRPGCASRGRHGRDRAALPAVRSNGEEVQRILRNLGELLLLPRDREVSSATETSK